MLMGWVPRAGLIADEMVELLCVNLQRDELLAVNTSMSGDNVTAETRETILKVVSAQPRQTMPSGRQQPAQHRLGAGCILPCRFCVQGRSEQLRMCGQRSRCTPR